MFLYLVLLHIGGWNKKIEKGCVFVKRVLLMVMMFLLVGVSNVLAADYPKSQGVVNDFALILSQSQEDQIKSDLIRFENKTTIEVAVVTIGSLNGETIENYTAGLANAWGVGKTGKDSGIMFLVAPNERKVRIAFGGGLQSTKNNQLAQEIIDKVVILQFKDGKMDQGVLLGVDSITKSFGNVSNEMVSPNISKLDEQRFFMFWKVLIVAILGSISAWYVYMITLWFIRARKFKNENQSLVFNCRKDFQKICDGLPKTKNVLADLEKKYTESIWQKHKAKFELIDVNEMKRLLLKAETECKKSIFFRKKARDLIDVLSSKIRLNLEILSNINSLPQAVIKAQMTITDSITETQLVILDLESLIVNGEVPKESVELFVKTKKIFLEKKQNYEFFDLEKVDWIVYADVFTKIFSATKTVREKIKNEIEMIEKAIIEGPKLLEQMPQMIKKMESMNFNSNKARQLAGQARDKSQQINALSERSNGSGINWLVLYLLLMDFNNSYSQAEIENKSYDSMFSNSLSSSKSSGSSWDSSSTSFDGGGGFSSDGGSSGSW